MMTNFRTDPNGEDPTDTRTGDVEEPGRVIGQVFNDIYFDRNQMSNSVRRAPSDREHPGRDLRPRRHGVPGRRDGDLRDTERQRAVHP